MSSSIVLTEKERAILTATGVAEPLPGTVLGNIDRLLAYIGTVGVAVSPKTSEFAIALLPEMNARLLEPGHIGLARGRQQSYPQLDGLHLSTTVKLF